MLYALTAVLAESKVLAKLKHTQIVCVCVNVLYVCSLVTQYTLCYSTCSNLNSFPQHRKFRLTRLRHVATIGCLLTINPLASDNK